VPGSMTIHDEMVFSSTLQQICTTATFAISVCAPCNHFELTCMMHVTNPISP
jgi:hypothetical protein